MVSRKLRTVPTKGAELVAAILAEMESENCEPTASETALLRLAHGLTDRIARFEQVIAAEGEMVTSPTGVVKVHPAVVEHRQLAIALTRVLGGIVIGDSGGAGKNPVKQRAANARWSAVAQQRESRERRLAEVSDGTA